MNEEENPSTPLFQKSNPSLPPPKQYSIAPDKESVSVIVELPQPVYTSNDSHYYQSSLMNDNYLMLSIGLTLLSLCFGCFPALFISIPAIIYSLKARKDSSAGDYVKMKAHEKTAFALNIFVFLVWIITFTIVVTVAYRVKCGKDGINCNTSPYSANHNPSYSG